LLHTRQPPPDYPITQQAIQIYRQMRRLDRRCECLPLEERKKTPGWTAQQCPACVKWWQLNAALNTELHCLEFPVYEAPEWERDYTPQPSAVARYYDFEAALQAEKKQKKPKYKYKWET
jgi:hypothetical protein